MKIIVAKYKENIDWTRTLGGEVIVINKDPDITTDYDLPNDCGRECSSYLDYIIKNYDSLDGEYLFTQGRHEDQAPELPTELHNKRYFGHFYECNEAGGPHLPTGAPLHQYCDFLEVEKKNHYKFRCGAFMRLNATDLKSHPKEYYKTMLNFAQTETISSHWFERLWPLVFAVLQKDL